MVGARADRRPSRRRPRRRLHRARRSGRRGHLGEAGADAERARELRVPFVRLVDGTGGGGCVKTLERAAHVRAPRCRAGSRSSRTWPPVPVVAAALGSVAGMGAARVVASHFAVIVSGTCSSSSPARRWSPRRWARRPTRRRSAASAIQTRAGAVDNEADSEDGRVRADPPLPLVPAAPAYGGPPPARAAGDPATGARTRSPLDPARTRARYEAAACWRWCVTAARCSRSAPRCGRPLVTGLARLDGYPVGVSAAIRRHYGGGSRRRVAEARRARGPLRPVPPARASTSSTSPAS